ncbi:HIT family protein [Desulfomonile tiedjei]|uniref:HIT family hydrolase, diadenosine tetraphosphate hydrolase n=1 Tax=Desulfomonile tiedjei (strain ATCC 49306 / DSM 6799 / DCB-1) TaxID=706587 RepID=I4C622_DESTA|nr:HIT family protein [Desulfomonile tiedjei]AFM25013.1 HIT family hydrolase, diadenosine tetraphosphate hydrolase [Desulfomonile tiedjei DSM 6799]
MRSDKNCIFCRIVAGEIPSTKVFEDDSVLAFMDISPLTPGHLLVVPKEHFETIADMDPQLFGRLASTVCILAKATNRSLKPDGLNILQLNGKAGNQVVPHVHMHLVPRWNEDGLTICAWEPVPGDKNEISQNASKIKDALQ